MSDMIKVDARGLSCPEPVLMTEDALIDCKGSEVCVLTDAAQSRDNIVNFLKRKKVECTVKEVGSDFEITFRA